MTTQSAIRTNDRPFCYLCGNRGEYIYERLQDRLFSVPGEWCFRKCPVDSCSLVWLDPSPLAEDTGQLYLNYYTHQSGCLDSESNGINKQAREPLHLPYSLVKRVLLIRRGRKRLKEMFLSGVKAGRLLEIGCGDGRRLLRLQKKGWLVEGQEVDKKAISNALSGSDLRIHEGELRELALGECTFDAVVLNHVIEHLLDPIEVLRECHRILKPGGRIVMVTPNMESLGHRHFGSSWRGLEPPRHFYIYNQRNLREVALAAGFDDTNSWTTAAKAETFYMGSISIQKGNPDVLEETQPFDIEFKAMLFQIKAALMRIFQPDSGEECVLVGYKREKREQ